MKNLNLDAVNDFIYAGERLSDYQMMLCRFDGGSGEAVSAGSNLNFNTVRPAGSDRFFLANTSYEEPLTTTFQICKNRCHTLDMSIKPEELSALLRWLGRKDGYHKLKLYQPDYENLFFIGSFHNIQEIKTGNCIHGLEITFLSDSPYAYMDTVELDFTADQSNPHTIVNLSHETGHLYPSVFSCKCLSSGNLQITNSIENRTTEIKNCVKDEIITLQGQTKEINSSKTDHMLYNDFNYNYFRLANTYHNNRNIITTSIPCEIHIEYNPIRKVGLG